MIDALRWAQKHLVNKLNSSVMLGVETLAFAIESQHQFTFHEPRNKGKMYPFSPRYLMLGPSCRRRGKMLPNRKSMTRSSAEVSGSWESGGSLRSSTGTGTADQERELNARAAVASQERGFHPEDPYILPWGF